MMMALGSLVLLGISSWLLYNDSPIGWVYFALGVLAWLLFVIAVALDIRQARKV